MAKSFRLFDVLVGVDPSNFAVRGGVLCAFTCVSGSVVAAQLSSMSNKFWAADESESEEEEEVEEDSSEDSSSDDDDKKPAGPSK